MERIVINGYEFKFIEKLIPIHKKTNIEIEKLNKYKGRELVSSLKNDISLKNTKLEDIDFCKFKLLSDDIDKSGVYIWYINNDVAYIGEASNLRKRFNYGYGNISPRNIFKGGQSTNCKMNRIAMKCFKENIDINIFFYETSNYKNVEQDLLDYNKKENKWNLYNSI